LYNWSAKHPDQKSTLPSDCSYTLVVPYSDARELLGDVLRFGADVEALAPKSLRASAMEALRLALGRYSA
jgi:predicted DNA-binding transcriptional regulator YafY